MLNRLHRFITPPVFEEEEKARLARLLHTVLIALIIGITLTGATLPILAPTRLHRLWINVVIGGLLVGHLALLRRGYVRQTTVLLAIVMWGAVTFASASVGGVSAAAFGGYIIIIIFVGLMIGQGASFIFAGLVFMSGLALLYAQSMGHLPPPPATTSPSLGNLLIHTFFAFMAALLVGLISHSLRQALERARQGETVLAERNRELQAEIQERLRVEEALRASDTQLRLALKSARMRAWKWDFITNQVTTIDHHIPGVSFDWVTFGQYTASIHPDDVERVKAAIQQSLEGSDPYTAEYRAADSDGSYIWLESLAQVQRDPQGNPLGMFGVSHDISERKQGEEQRLELRFQKERLSFLTEFMSNMSHDIRTPLTIIKTSIYLMQHVTDPEKQQQRLQIITEQVDLVESYIRDILTIARLDHTPQANLESLDINRMAQIIEEKLRPTAEHKHITLELNLKSELPTILADEQQLDHALTNLVENALNYTPQSGSVRISSCLEDQTVILEITDTGIGIPKTDLENIFNRFYRGENARQTRKSGTGLGLAIAQKIVDMHQGKIVVSSEPGVGSTFRVILPTVAD